MKNVTLLRGFVEDNRISMERYSDGLLTSLANEMSGEASVADFRPQFNRITSLLPGGGNTKMRFARFIDYPIRVKKLRSDIFHITDHGYAPLIRNLPADKTIVTVHDMIPVLAGKGLIPGTSLRRSWLAEYCASYYKKAAYVVTVSENTRADIIKYCGCDPEKVKVIYPGLDEAMCAETGADKRASRAQLGLPAEGCLILVTGGQFYKNPCTSLAVVDELIKRTGKTVSLVRLGEDSPSWQQALKEFPHIAVDYCFNKVGAEVITDLYQAVDCLLFPSWYEGFGWPPIEAMACGTPAVTSNRASLREVVGESGPVFDADDVCGMTDEIEKLLTDRNYHSDRVKRGLEQAQKFTWQNTAVKISDLYRELF